MATRHIQGVGSSAGDAATELARIKGDTAGSGPIVYDLVDGILKWYDRVNSVVRQAAALNPAPVSITSSTSLTNALHVGRPVVVNAAAGLTLTMPAATGSGDRYMIHVGTTITSNAIVISPTGDDKMFGQFLINNIGDSSAATVDAYPNASGDNTITLTASVGAGKKGDRVELVDIAADSWGVLGFLSGEADPVNPFSTV